SLLLALIGIAVGGRWWLLALPLLVTWTMCVKGALSAPLAPRFDSPKARALVALLIYLGPLLRGWARLKWRLKMTRAWSPPRRGLVEQRGRVDWRARAFVLSYWHEDGADKETMLGALMRRLAAHRHQVAIDDGWGDWDLEIATGTWGRARVTL